MNRMAKKTRRQKGGGFFSDIFHPRFQLPKDVNDPNYLIDLMLYRGNDSSRPDIETLHELEQYSGEYDPFEPTSHTHKGKGESLLDMAHKRGKIKVVSYLLLRYCELMTAERYWKAINFIKDYPRYDQLWENINSKARANNIAVLDPDLYTGVYSHNKTTGVYSELKDKSPLYTFLARDGQPGLILPNTMSSRQTMQGGKRKRTRKFLKL